MTGRTMSRRWASSSVPSNARRGTNSRPWTSNVTTIDQDASPIVHRHRRSSTPAQKSVGLAQTPTRRHRSVTPSQAASRAQWRETAPATSFVQPSDKQPEEPVRPQTVLGHSRFRVTRNEPPEGDNEDHGGGNDGRPSTVLGRRSRDGSGDINSRWSRRASTPAALVGAHTSFRSGERPCTVSATASRQRRNSVSGGIERIVPVGQGYQRVGTFAQSDESGPGFVLPAVDTGINVSENKPEQQRANDFSSLPPALRPRTQYARKPMSSSSSRGGARPGPSVAAEIFVWGWNGDGQCGLDRTANKSLTEPHCLSQLTQVNVIAIASSSFHVLANAADGSVYAWGSNTNGQLGAEPSNDRKGDHRCKPAAVESLAAERIWRVAAGNSHSIAVTYAGRVLTWGDPSGGRLGVSIPMESTPGLSVSRIAQRSTEGTPWHTPQPVKALRHHVIVDVAAGIDHSLALTSTGRVFSWGVNNDGQLGRAGGQNGIAHPISALDETTIVGIAAGDYHSLVVAEDGHVLAFGCTGYGRLGIGTPDTSAVLAPTRVHGLEDAVLVSAGGATSLAVTRDGLLFSWGCNHSGQLGLGTVEDAHEPVQVTSFHDVGVAIHSACAGGDHAIAVSTAGNVYTWGRVSHGRLGSTEIVSEVQATPYLLEVFARRSTRVSHVLARGSHTIAAVLRAQKLNRAPSATAPSQCIAYGEGLRRCRNPNTNDAEPEPALPPLAAGQWYTFTIQARDCDGCDRTTGGDVFAMTVNGNVTEYSVHDCQNGKYNVKYRVSDPGMLSIEVYVYRMQEDDRGSAVIGACTEAIKGSPFNQMAVAGPTKPSECECIGDGTKITRAGEVANFEIRTGRNMGGDMLTISLGAVTDLHDGTYSAQYVAETAGPLELHVKMYDEHLPGSPFSVNVLPGSLCGSRCTATGQGIDGPIMADTSTTFTIQARDAFNNNCIAGGATFWVQVTSGSTSVLTSVHDHDDGTYSCVYQPTVSGEHFVAVMHSEEQDGAPPILSHIIGSPFTIVADKKPRHPVASECQIQVRQTYVSGVVAKIPVIARDFEGDILLGAGECPFMATLELEGNTQDASSEASCVIQPAVDGGHCQVVVTATTPGVYSLRVWLGPNEIVGGSSVAVSVVDAIVWQFHRSGFVSFDQRLDPRSFYYLTVGGSTGTPIQPFCHYGSDSFVIADHLSGNRIGIISCDCAKSISIATQAAKAAETMIPDMQDSPGWSRDLNRCRIIAMFISTATGGATAVGVEAPPTEILGVTSLNDAGGMLRRAFVFKMACDQLDIKACVRASTSANRAKDVGVFVRYRNAEFKVEMNELGNEVVFVDQPH